MMGTVDVAPEAYASVSSQWAIDVIVRLLSMDTGHSVTMPYPPYAGLRLSALRGLGKEVWQGIDPKDYIKRLRDEWER